MKLLNKKHVWLSNISEPSPGFICLQKLLFYDFFIYAVKFIHFYVSKPKVSKYFCIDIHINIYSIKHLVFIELVQSLSVFCAWQDFNILLAHKYNILELIIEKQQ